MFAVLAATVAASCGGDDESAATNSATETTSTTAGGSEAGTDEPPPSEFGPEQMFELRLNEDPVPELVLEMDRSEVAELFGDRASEVLLLEVDSTVLLTNTLDAIKAACGDDWQLDDSDPNHDCSQTKIGQAFEGPDGTWQTSPEYALVRILTMTPANAVVDGTSSNTLQNVADFFGIGGGYGQILADGLGIARTESIVPTWALVEAFQTDFVATHPAVGDDAALPLYLDDALADLATMTDRFGPSADHPGIIDPDVVVSGQVFTDDFQMRVVADSNLRLVDGIDADGGKGFVSVIDDTTGPTYDDALEFAFDDPERFKLTGLVEDLVVDLGFRVEEFDGFVDSCLGSPPCHSNLPGTPVDDASVWAREPWELEYVIAHAGLFAYEDRTFTDDYLLGAASIDIGQDGNPPGWVEYNVPIIGPESQYVWETLLEVGQVALHDTPYAEFDEGETDVEFTVRDIPVGLTGEEAAEAVRPYLQEQSGDLSEFILGDFTKNNDRVDFWYRRAENGEAYLFFVAPGDISADEPYGYDRPGFYSDAGLSAKVSREVVNSVQDIAHEKLLVDRNETTVYYADEAGTVHRVRIEATDNVSQLRVFIATESG